MEDLPGLTHAIVAARIPYANVAPFYALWHEAPFAVRNLVPRDLGREAEAGHVDFGSMAAGDYLRLKDRFELIQPPMGAAARGEVQSVLLFSRRPAEALAGALVSVTPATSTSVRLLHLLLDVRRGLRGVRYIRGLEPAQADALLVIGDAAMRMRNHRPEGFTHTLDLGADWLEWTGLSFVYAVWAVRTDARPGGQGGDRTLPRGLAGGGARLAARGRAPADRAGLAAGGGRGLPAALPLPARPRGPGRARALRGAAARPRPGRAGLKQPRPRTRP